MKSGVVGVKTSLETLRQFLGIEHQPANERAGSVSIVMKNVRQERESSAQQIAHVIHVMKLRVGASENCCMRRCGYGIREVTGRKNLYLRAYETKIRVSPRSD